MAQAAIENLLSETSMNSRRRFIQRSAGVLLGAAVVNRAAQGAVPEAPLQAKPETQPPLVPSSGRPYKPVITLNGWSLPWRMNNGWKEFHLIAEPVRRQIAPGMTAHLWGYNGQSPGPTIECVEGDKVRIFVTNKLPEHTTIHWHGILLPNGMDGVGGLNQPHIPVGRTFVYEFVMPKSGTFMYHPHADEMVQMAMGMMGFIVVHPKDPSSCRWTATSYSSSTRFSSSPARTRPRWPRCWTSTSGRGTAACFRVSIPWSCAKATAFGYGWEISR
jgi:FtsP/CotA-like multicopper oxidase with cupredoxin domain